MTIDKRLKAIVRSVARSTLSEHQKAQIYVTITRSLHAAAVPVLVKHIPEEDLAALDKAGASASPQEYVAMITKALNKPELAADLSDLIGRVLGAIEAELKTHFLMS